MTMLQKMFTCKSIYYTQAAKTITAIMIDELGHIKDNRRALDETKFTCNQNATISF